MPKRYIVIEPGNSDNNGKGNGKVKRRRFDRKEKARKQKRKFDDEHPGKKASIEIEHQR